MPNGGFILVRDMKKALDGDDFLYFKETGMPPILVEGFPQEEQFYYFGLWKNYLKFGLPRGGGWMGELAWVIDFLGMMDDTKNAIEAWRATKK